MFSDISRDIKYQLRTGGFLIRVIVICVAVFFVINILKSYFILRNHGMTPGEYNEVLKYLSLSSDLWFNLKFPWVWITHIFTHEGLFHLLWNMMALYWFGMIVEDFIGRKHIIRIFFQGALMGAVFFLLSASIIPWYAGHLTIAYGASASVMALLLAAATLSPDYSIRLLIFGTIPIKYLAAALLFIDLLMATQNQNTGGHFAHLGGALWGYLYILLLRNGYQMDVLSLFVENKRKLGTTAKMSVARKPKSAHKTEIISEDNLEEKLNVLLDKIKNQGIESLTEKEKQDLEFISRHKL